MKWPFRRAGRPKPYYRRHFAQREKFRADYEELAGYLLSEVEFDSALDVGCANGFLLERFQREGKTVAGVELSADVRSLLPAALQEVVQIGDFAAAAGEWELVCCVEVAEHIEPERSRELVESLARLATGSIYFTAAPPGQSGHGHINCRPHEEWLAWFADSGWRVDEAATRRLRAQMEGLRETPWLGPNSFLLEPAGESH